MEMLRLRFSKIWKIKAKTEQTQTRHRFFQHLQTIWRVSKIPCLYTSECFK